MALLQAEGLVRTTRGSGTFVARSTPAASGSIAAFAGIVARQDGTQMETVNEFTFANFVAAEPHVAEALDVDVGAEVIKRFRYRRTGDGEPVLIRPRDRRPGPPALIGPFISGDGSLTAEILSLHRR